MELTPLRYVVALAQERHFLKAARRAHVSQPTLSQQIKKLERELGVALFERSPRNVRLTPAGERFVPQAQEILRAVGNALESARDPHRPPTGRVAVAAIPTLAPYVLPPVLRRLRRSAPGLQLEVHELTTSHLVAALRDGTLDLGLLALPIEERTLVARSLGREPFFLAVSARHPLAKKRFVTRTELADERLLILQEGHCFRDQSLEFCQRKAEDAHIIFQGSSLGSVLKLAEVGEGVTLVPQLAVDRRAYPGLRFVPFAPPAPHRELGLLWRSSFPLSRGHALLIDEIEKTIEELL